MQNRIYKMLLGACLHKAFCIFDFIGRMPDMKWVWLNSNFYLSTLCVRDITKVHNETEDHLALSKKRL